MKREVDHAIGVFNRIAFGTKDGTQQISDRKLRSFITILTELLLARYEKNWYPDNPDRGSGYRCIRINRQCIDPTILKSLKKSDIDINQNLRSQELTIWVDPGVVSIRIGEEGSIGTEVVDEELYQRTLKGARHGSIGSDSEESTSSSRSASPKNDSLSSSPSRSSPSLMSRSKSPSSSPPPPFVQHPSQEWNPYRTPSRVVNSNFQPSLVRQQSPPQYPSRNMSPPSSTSQYVNSSVRPMPSTMMAQGASPMMPAKMSSGEYIPSQHPTYSYTRPRNLFPNNGDFESVPQPPQGDHFGKLAFNPYSMNYGGSIAQGNFTDIPAMA